MPSYPEARSPRCEDEVTLHSSSLPTSSARACWTISTVTDTAPVEIRQTAGGPLASVVLTRGRVDNPSWNGHADSAQGPERQDPTHKRLRPPTRMPGQGSHYGGGRASCRCPDRRGATGRCRGVAAAAALPTSAAWPPRRPQGGNAPRSPPDAPRRRSRPGKPSRPGRPRPARAPHPPSPRCAPWNGWRAGRTWWSAGRPGPGRRSSSKRWASKRSSAVHDRINRNPPHRCDDRLLPTRPPPRTRGLEAVAGALRHQGVLELGDRTHDLEEHPPVVGEFEGGQRGLDDLPVPGRLGRGRARRVSTRVGGEQFDRVQVQYLTQSLQPPEPHGVVGAVEPQPDRSPRPP